MLPLWFVKACKVYYVCVRPKFIPPYQPATKPIRSFTEDVATGCPAYTVSTDYFFYNTSKLRKFKVSTLITAVATKLRKTLNQSNDLLTRKINMIFPADETDYDAKIENDTTMMKTAMEELDVHEYNKDELRAAIDKRNSQLQYVRSGARAAVYIGKYPSWRTSTDGEMHLMDKYYKSKGWTGDFTKFLNNVRQMRQAKSARNATRFIDPMLKLKDTKGENADDTQMEISHRIAQQTWQGIEDAFFPGFGRGVMATMPFTAGDIIVDYHGTISNLPYETYITQLLSEGIFPIPEFILVIPHTRKLIDATSEKCPYHGNNRCLGRLSNHANMKSKNKSICNMKPVYVVLDSLPKDSHGKFQKVVLFVARRNIQPLEQLRWDYEDKTAQTLLTE